jgi:hypothetical protein
VAEIDEIFIRCPDFLIRLQRSQSALQTIIEHACAERFKGGRKSSKHEEEAAISASSG